MLKYDNSQDIYMSNIEFFYLNYPSTLRELMTLLRHLLPQFDTFPDSMKISNDDVIEGDRLLEASMFTNLIGKFNALEYYFYSVGRFNRIGVCMCSLTTVFDTQRIEEWATPHKGVRNNDLVRSVRTFAVEYMGILNRLLESEGITETEFVAIIAILICQMDTTIDLPDEIQHIFEETRARVFIEMQEYYRKELGISDFSSRLGNLMSLSAALSEMHLKSEEQLHLYSFLFNVQPLRELLKQAMD
ncbi:hypothetical protein PMAYCL1PPCAC_17507 [Pristionchus mayeri]|uniref:NR LBD domain-containing protein n=1 Tax=Pristionchus mayeri TaxID=1317129 RepID=A0AAN5CMT6_9BILA|nr:hypothetical protein PMAYCL1PPCAC_17507 [Pristionchus mayeri]